MPLVGMRIVAPYKPERQRRRSAGYPSPPPSTRHRTPTACGGGLLYNVFLPPHIATNVARTGLLYLVATAPRPVFHTVACNSLLPPHIATNVVRTGLLYLVANAPRPVFHTILTPTHFVDSPYIVLRQHMGRKRHALRGVKVTFCSSVCRRHIGELSPMVTEGLKIYYLLFPTPTHFVFFKKCQSLCCCAINVYLCTL